jgi:hypothetical protein
MAESRFSSPGHEGASAQTEAVHDQVPEVVQEAQLEFERLMASLSEEAQTGKVPGPLYRIGRTKGVDAKAGQTASRSAGKPAETNCVADVCPLYLIISSRRALTEAYGRLGFERLDSDLRELRQAVEDRVDVKTVVLYVDDEGSLDRYGLEPVDPANPYRIKMLIDTLDARLAEGKRRIRYLLIIGGDEIIPFHRLPNPVEDQDEFVLSDNPYACRGRNYLVPDRAVGRLPDGESEGRGRHASPTNDASIAFLHSLIQTAAEGHRNRVVSKGLRDVLRSALHFLKPKQTNGRGLGYSASIWRKASRAVFLSIGADSQLRTSPPLTYEGFRIVDRPHFSYFNLHGIEDGPNWYGQRDSLFPANYPPFPLALRPQDLGIDDCADSVVLTEACYGANILGKGPSDSIALRFLAGRALAVVGSTKVAYGSIAPPLLGADLIGKYFWEGLRDHLTAGDALVYAKANLAREMQQRQGYLDGEDQKALISFVLYGDPLLPIVAVQGRTPAVALRQGFCPAIICGKETEVQNGVVSDELVARVKGCIETSLPHMTQARVRAKPVGLGHGAGQAASAASLHSVSGGRPRPGRGRWALTLAKDIAVEGDAGDMACLPLHQVVKAIFDENGHILRMAVSK